MTRFSLSAILVAIAVAGASVATAQLTVGGASYDHLACYSVTEPLTFKGEVTLDAAFEDLDIPSSCKVVGRVMSYCVPVTTRVDRLRHLEGVNSSPVAIPGPDQGDGRLCYQLKCKPQPVEGPLRFEDQFGQHALRDFNLKALCTTARAIPNITTTTTTTSTTSTTLEVDPCLGVECDSDHYCRPTCEDRKQSACLPYKEEGDDCGGFVPPCKEALCKLGLECLVPPNIPNAPGICVDPERRGCERDSDCRGSEICERGPSASAASVCVRGCRSDKHCAKGQHCQQLECLASPCPGICVDDEAEAECSSDADCGGGEICEPGGPGYPGQTVCVQGCRNDKACMEGQHCQVVVCLTTPCPPQCVGDPPENCGECIKDSDCGQQGWRCTSAETCLRSCECPKCKVCAGNCVPPAGQGGE